jgi:hypothetical protein
VLGDDGSGSSETVICGINWVVANAARLNIKVGLLMQRSAALLPVAGSPAQPPPTAPATT